MVRALGVAVMIVVASGLAGCATNAPTADFGRFLGDLLRRRFRL